MEGSGTDRVLGAVLTLIAEAMRDGHWQRMKACRNPACRWVFYDHSRNRTGIWCSMRICGNRQQGARAPRPARGSRRGVSASSDSPSRACDGTLAVGS